MPTHGHTEQEEEHAHDRRPDRSGRTGKQRYQVVDINQECVSDEKNAVQKAGKEAGNARPVITGSPGAEV